jgi:hypothetical protein
MIPSSLEQLEAEVRGAAASRRYADTARLAAEFGKALRAYAQTFPRNDPRAREAARKLHEVLSWTLLMLKAARASCAAELRRVTTAGRYVRPCGQPGRTARLRLDG